MNRFLYPILFLGMAVVAMMQIATVKILWIGLVGSALLPAVMTLLLWTDKHPERKIKTSILWSAFLVGSGLGLMLYFFRPLLHLSS